MLIFVHFLPERRKRNSDGHRERKRNPEVQILGDYCLVRGATPLKLKKKKQRNSGKNRRSPILKGRLNKDYCLCNNEEMTDRKKRWMN